MSRKFTFMAACGLMGYVFTLAGVRAQVVLTGDANLDGRISVADPLAIRRWFFEEDAKLDCLEAADADGDGLLTFEDPLSLFSDLFVDAPRGTRAHPELRHFFFLSEFPSRGEAGGGPPDRSPAPRTKPTPGEVLGCDDPSIDEPATTDEIVRFGEVPARVGGRVVIPVYVDSSSDLDAFQLVIRYDPDLFVPEGVLAFANFFRASEKLRREVFRETRYEDCARARCDQMLLHIRSFPEDGILVVAFYSSLFREGSELPAGSSTAVFNIVGTVTPEASPGQSLTLEPADRGFGPHDLRNELVHRGASRFLATRPMVEAVTLSIIPDISIFNRGDANLDGVVEVSDVVRILTRLFLADPRPFLCDDAADVNDDGELDISDAVAALIHLFLGGFSIPEPYPVPGIDPTPDPLFCSGPRTGTSEP